MYNIKKRIINSLIKSSLKIQKKKKIEKFTNKLLKRYKVLQKYTVFVVVIVIVVIVLVLRPGSF